jgi:hypothetical protein
VDAAVPVVLNQPFIDADQRGQRLLQKIVSTHEDVLFAQEALGQPSLVRELCHASYPKTTC